MPRQIFLDTGYCEATVPHDRLAGHHSIASRHGSAAQPGLNRIRHRARERDALQGPHSQIGGFARSQRTNVVTSQTGRASKGGKFQGISSTEGTRPTT